MIRISSRFQPVLSLAIVCLLWFGARADAQFSNFIRGDVDQDTAVLINDPIALLSVLFGPSAPLPCEQAADANDDDQVNIGDAVYLLAFLFAGGAAPPEPYPSCGSDWDGGLLQCLQPTPACLPPTYTYVLNSTSTAGGSADSVLEFVTDHTGVPTVTPYIDSDPQYDGLKHLGVSFGDVFVVQENATLGQHRVLQLSVPGTVQDQLSTYPGEAQAMVVSDYGYLILVTTSSSPASTWVVRYDYFSSWDETVLLQLDEEYDVRGATIDTEESVFFTGSGSAGAGVFRVTSSGDFELIYPDSGAGSIHYSVNWGALWYVSTPSGSEGQLVQIDPQGFLFDQVPLGFGVDPVIGDVGVQDSGLLIPFREDNVIVEFDTSVYTFETVLGASVGVDHPIDATGPFSFAIP